MKILVLNCGSSSVKYKLLDMTSKEVLGSGGVEKIGMKGSFLKHTKQNGEKVILEGEVLEHQLAIEYILGVLTSTKHGCIKNMEEIDAVGHRVVHGGEKFNSSVVITDEVIRNIEACIEIAPLHNPPNLAGIFAISDLLPQVPQVAVFDTAFHQTMPEHAYMYGIPYTLYKKYGIRRYGFHGTSHRYVSRRACEFLGLDYNKTKIITAHIGNGGSITAIENGKSVDTSMGFTPVEGLMMGTRSGDMDPAIVGFIAEKENLTAAEVINICNKNSGVLGLSGISSDFRDLVEAAAAGNDHAQTTLEAYAYRVGKYIGAYAAAMNGVDAIVFTAGIGENNAQVRALISQYTGFLGCEIDLEKNKAAVGVEAVISTPESKVTALVVPTNEELAIARETVRLVNA